MIVPDVNGLVYAHRADTAEHEPARRLLESKTAAGRPLGLADARGNLVPDAHLAALASSWGAELVSADRGFARFPGLRFRALGP